jgi:[ribosomal protein S5]-alanine N-acetyltransferase
MNVLQTPRLALRWFGAHDAAVVVELLNDPLWLRFIGERHVRSEDDARAWIESRLVEAYRRQGYGLWAMVRRDDDAVIGMCGFVRRDTLPDVDIGYALLPRFRGQGYVREAAAACLAHGATVLGFRRILAITRPANQRSIAVLQSLGMVLERTAVLGDDDHESLVFALDTSVAMSGADCTGAAFSRRRVG